MPTNSIDLGEHRIRVRTNWTATSEKTASVHSELVKLSESLGAACSSKHFCRPKKGERVRFTGSVADNLFQVHTYLSLVSALAHARKASGEPTVVCETGFNAGHSALLFLLAHPTVQYYGWELGDPYGWASKGSDPAKRLVWASRQAERLLTARFPGRINITYGDSHQTIVPFFRMHPEIQCDITSIDGDHTQNGVKQDLEQFEPHFRDGSLILVDDCREGAGKGKMAPKWMSQAYANFVHSKRTELHLSLEVRVELGSRHGFCIAAKRGEAPSLPPVVEARLRKISSCDYR